MLAAMNALARLLLPAVLAGFAAGFAASVLHYQLAEPLLSHLLGESIAQRTGLRHWAGLLMREIPPAILQATALIGLWQWRGVFPDWRQGVAWGIAGFAAAAVLRFGLLPLWPGVPALPPLGAGVPIELQQALRWALLLCSFLTWLVLGLGAARAWRATRPKAHQHDTPAAP